MRPPARTPRPRGPGLSTGGSNGRSSRRAGAVALAVALASGLAACAGGPTTPPPALVAEGPVVPTEVSDAQLAEAVHHLLREGDRSPARLSLLVGVVRRTLAHAADRFAAGQDARGAEAVSGAFALIRKGEARAEMIDASGERALAGMLARASARGNEGQAAALLRMRRAALPAGAPALAEIDAHLAALDRWTSDTRSTQPEQALGDAARTAIARASIDPSDEAVAAAAKAVDAWIARAIEYNLAFRENGERPSREEAFEASRALETGATTMAALYLRHGDARGARDQIQGSEVRRIIRPVFFQRIHAAAELDGAREWKALAASIAQGEYGEHEGSFEPDPETIAAALWGTMLEAYRRDPTDPAIAADLAHALPELGLPEVAPLVLADALGPEPSAAELSSALREVALSLDRQSTSDDVAGARRTFAAASRILALADAQPMRGKLDPSAPRVRYFMASIEFRAGNLAGARPLLEAAVSAEPAVSGYTLLATLERQAGNREAAAAHIDRALHAPDRDREPLDVADAQLLDFEIHRDGVHGDASEEGRANAALDAALRAVLAARSAPSSGPAKARAERLLGRILDSYGDGKGATRALDRALDLAGNDRPALGATMLDAVGRALVRRDVSAARAALKRGLEADVNDEDLVYAGMWLLFLERQLKVAADGTAERALRTAGDRASWTAKLAAWATGRLSDADLGTLAQSPSQKVEAKFYTALAGKVAGHADAEAALRDVAQSPVIDLLEVQLAREIMAPPLRAELPRNVSIP